MLTARMHLVHLLKRARQISRMGYVPAGLMVQIAIARAAIPDPLTDGRDRVEDSKTSRRLMGITRGKRITSPSQSALWRGGRHWNGWERAERSLPVPGVVSRRLLARQWARRERPAKVSLADWELLRLVTVEQMKVPAIAKLPAYTGIRVQALQKRIQRARAAQAADPASLSRSAQ